MYGCNLFPVMFIGLGNDLLTRGFTQILIWFPWIWLPSLCGAFMAWALQTLNLSKRQPWFSHSALVESWSETLMERVDPAEQSTQKKGLVSGWNLCLAAKSSLRCSRARSSVSMCNLTLWGDSLSTIYCRYLRCQGKDCKDSREDSLYAILK